MSEGIKIIIKNKKAHFDYDIEETLEAGIVLKGTEVKSLRQGKVSLQEAYCSIDRHGDMYLHGCHIAPYDQGGHYNHDPQRDRKLLLHNRELYKWEKASSQQGYTIVPIKLYFRRGYAKLEIGLGKGKKKHDKRQDIKEKETKRRMDEAMKEYR